MAGHVSGIVACGGVGHYPPSEAEVISKVCQELGVPEVAVLQEKRSTTTEENLRFALVLLNTPDVIIVTDRYHAPRARLIARRLGLNATTDCPPIPQGRRKHVVRQTLREVPAYLWYWLRKR